MSLAVRVEHVQKTFGRVRAVDDVSFESVAGELFFLLGPSGCGKTTLLRAIAGFAEIDSGEIFLGQRRLTNVPPHQRNTGMVFQNYALWPHMTVLENLMFGLELRGLNRADRRKKALQALATVQLEPLAERKPNQLSGGQQQRVALARALAIEPDCLLLDEPLSNLDAKLRLEMRSEIRRIHEETGLTIIYVTHDQKEALSLADRVALMRDGRIVQLAPPRDLYYNPASRFAAGFLGEANFIAGKFLGTTDGRSQLESPLGPLQGRPPAEPLAAGADCQVMIRPESLEIMPATQTRPPNSFRAEVLQVMFLGELEQVTLRAEGGREFKSLRVPQPGTTWQRGTSVWLTFEWSTASVFGGTDTTSE